MALELPADARDGKPPRAYLRNRGCRGCGVGTVHTGMVYEAGREMVPCGVGGCILPSGLAEQPHARELGPRRRLSFRVADKPSEWTKAAGLELQFGHQLQEPNQCCAFIRSQLMPDILIGGHPGLDQPFPILLSFAS